MDTENNINYQRVAKAIDYINKNFEQQPSLEEIAEHIHLSPFHFQRLFTNWAGISPKKFLQYTSIQHAKNILQNSSSTLLDTAYKTGLSGTGRLHDLFIKIEGMSPGEYKKDGDNLAIYYQYSDSIFGQILVASTEKGICYMGFSDDKESAFLELKTRFPLARYTEQKTKFQQNALQIFTSDWNNINQIKLHLKGTEFQLKVWEALLNIPMGHLTTYGDIAQSIQKPSASRAVGTAIGKNPIAFLIPCHRVIQASGNYGGYMWGETRKRAIIGWEASKLS